MFWKKTEENDEDYYYVKVHKDKLNAIIAIVSLYVFYKVYFGVCDLLGWDSFWLLFIFVFAAAPVTALMHKGIMAFLKK
ncbi:MAG: hypothetical protein J6B39_05975 [Lachnospiraceae bacterium]|nr:hypothetical protein [Lachnospiraceae bacterium]